MLVTISTYLIVSLIFRTLVTGAMSSTLDIAPGLMYVVAFIAVIVAVGIALLSSIGKDHRNKFWSTLVVYAGSGILAVLYIIMLTIRLRVVYPYYSSWMITTLLLIAAFLSITRFFKSKGLGIVFAIIPIIMSSFLFNIMNLVAVSTYYQQTIELGLVLILLFVLFYRGRAQLLGQSLDKQYRTKSWIAFIPLFLVLLINGMKSPLYMGLTSAYADIILLLAGVGICIVHVLVKPKGSNIV